MYAQEIVITKFTGRMQKHHHELLLCGIICLLLCTEKGKTEEVLFADYMYGMSSCWMPYIMSIMDPMVRAIPTTQLNRGKREIASGQETAIESSSVNRTSIDQKLIIMMLQKAFVKNCGDTLNRALQCHQQLNQQAGYKLLNTQRLGIAIQSMCNNMQKLRNLSSCVTQHSMQIMILCLSGLKYDGDLCSYTGKFKQCITNTFTTCSAIQKMFSNIIDVVSLDKCVTRTTPVKKQCAGLSSMITTAMCYTGFITKMVTGAFSVGAKHMFLLACRDGSLTESLACHKKVEDDCAISYINVDELASLKENTCQHLEKFETLEQCVSNKTGTTFLGCINRITVNDDNTLCRLTNTYRTCGSQAFTTCDTEQKLLVNNMFDLALLTCPITPESSCSLLEHGTTLAMCWYPTFQTLIPWTLIRGGQSQYNPVVAINNLCGTFKSRITKSIKCHLAADQKCGHQMMRESELRTSFTALCSNPAAILKMTTCVSPGMSLYTQCALKLKQFNPTSSDYFCDMATHMRTCFEKMFSNCTKDVQNLFNQMLFMFKDAKCQPKQPQKTTTTTAATDVKDPIPTTTPASASTLTLFGGHMTFSYLCFGSSVLYKCMSLFM